jgi:hypothetical protein
VYQRFGRTPNTTRRPEEQNMRNEVDNYKLQEKLVIWFMNVFPLPSKIAPFCVTVKCNLKPNAATANLFHIGWTSEYIRRAH